MKFSGSMVNEKKLNLQAEIDDRSGFCFGVINAVKKAEELLDQGEKVFCVGEIVHNDEEVKRLSKKGLITIEHQELENIKNSNILFRAHGEPPSTYKKVRMNNNKIYDASCPIVLNLQKAIKNAFENGENIFIYGKKDHPEVIGLMAQTNNQAVVFEDPETLKHTKLPGTLTLFSQTTKSLDKFHQAVDYLNQRGVDVSVRDTICRQVANREHELKTFSKKHDKIVFIAGKNSSNGKVLHSICKQYNENSYFVSSTNEIDSSWFNPGETVGVCGATSTPQWLLEDVKKKLENL